MNKLKKFQPLNVNATINIDSLLKRGGKIVVEKREFVDINTRETLQYKTASFSSLKELPALYLRKEFSINKEAKRSTIT